MLTGGLKEARESTISIPEMKSSVFGSLIHYLYTNQLESTPDDTIDLLIVAEEYSLPHLKVLCETDLREQIDSDNAAYLFSVSNLYDAQALKSSSLVYIRNHFQEVSQSFAWSQLSEEEKHFLSK